jgi:hypothetical protein
MHIFQLLARKIIKHSFHLSVWTIEQFHEIALYEKKARQLQELPEGTLGRDIADCLARNGLRLVPNFESHDLKHVLLNFQMTPVDEIRMQAFMLGNGNYSIPSFSIFIFGVIFLPDMWATFYEDFKNGRKSKPISSWTIEEYAWCRTSTLREIVFNYSRENNNQFDMNKIAKLGSYTAIILGTFGMLFCLPFLFSDKLIDVVGAGFPFLSGAIIASTGLFALANFSKQGKQGTESLTSVK